jgi:hypothetical protein
MKLDYDYAQFEVKEPGTVVINGNFSGAKDESGNFGFGSSYSHVKAFLNLTNDGTATKRFGGGGVLEVVFAEDVPAGGLKVGDEVKFRFYHNGVPLKNAPVFAAYEGAPVYEEEEEGQIIEVNDYLNGVTDGDGIASFTLDHAAGWFVGAFRYENEGTPDLREYGGGVVFGVSEEREEDAGSGGCNAGARGGLGIIVLMPVVFMQVFRPGRRPGDRVTRDQAGAC